MRILIFDTETTGLPKTKIINPEKLNDWPYIVQFSYIMYDSFKNEIIKTRDHIIKMTDGYCIPEESIKFHQITNEISKKKGIQIEVALNEFFLDLSTVEKLVAHNISFDINMVKVELLRSIYLNINNINAIMLKECKFNFHTITTLTNAFTYCTLQNTINLCAIKMLDKTGKEYFKYPKLEELHEKLFNKKPSNLHNSLNDVLITLRCFCQINNNIDLYEKSDSFKTMVDEYKLL